jgi:N-acetyl-gamma-glutamyl-phosphate reductase
VAAFDAAQLTVDFVFMALPHSQSAQYAAEIEVPVVDLGADFRLEDAAAWSAYYGGEHAGTWTYGLPEIPGQRAKIAESTKVANPGCYATAIAVAAAPLVAAGVVDPTQIVVVAASGTSGAGRSPSVPLMASEVTSGVRAYKVGGRAPAHAGDRADDRSRRPHQFHADAGPDGTRHPRHRHRTRAARGGSGRCRGGAARSYDAETFVRLLPEGQWPATQMTLGTNSVALQWAYDAHAGRVIVCSAIDNLGKGAAGQAIQNANLMLGFPEASGLAVNGVAP